MRERELLDAEQAAHCPRELFGRCPWPHIICREVLNFLLTAR